MAQVITKQLSQLKGKTIEEVKVTKGSTGIRVKFTDGTKVAFVGGLHIDEIDVILL